MLQFNVYGQMRDVAMEPDTPLLRVQRGVLIDIDTPIS